MGIGNSHWIIALALDGLGEKGRATSSPFESAGAKFRRRAEPCSRVGTLNLEGGRGTPGRARSNQNEIEQREKRHSNAGRDQGEVSAEVRFRVERGLVGLLGHVGGLGQAGRLLCEAGHIWPIFFRPSRSGTSWRRRD